MSKELKTVEEYAIALVVEGAESRSEDDMNEDGQIADEGHEKACALAWKIAQAIRANPAVVLGLVER